MIITIDGPTASGKSSVARMLAQHLHFYYLSSGILFRGLAYILIHEFHYQEKNIENVRIEDLCRAIDPKRFIYRYSIERGEQLFFDGIDISNHLRNPMITQYSSLLGGQPLVRDALLKLQHAIAGQHDLVAEGRDIGSTVFAQAEVKFYLTASLSVRVQRWYQDQKAKGVSISQDQALKNVQERDERDMNRSIAPLVIPENAIIIDSSALSKEQVLSIMLEHIKQTNPSQ